MTYSEVPQRVEQRGERGEERVAPLAGDRSLGELFGQFSADLSTLFRKEIELAKVEVRDELATGRRAGLSIGIAAGAGAMALLLVSFAAAWGLAAVMPTGLAFLIVGVVYAVVALVLFQRAREALKEFRPVPEQTVETLKEDLQWAKQQMS